MTLVRPVASPTGISSWAAHQRRSPKSTEPGTDYYCRIGTPVYAPAAGIVGMTGDSIVPATGRFVFIKFDNGQSGRALHLSRRVVNVNQRVKAGQLIGYSGASGYGEEDWSWNPDTGGAHVHFTLWPTHTMRFGYRPNGTPYTLDPEAYMSGRPAGNEDDMVTQAEIDAIAAATAAAVWDKSYVQRQIDGKPTNVSMKQEIVNLPGNVWARTVQRIIDGVTTAVPALQELADSKTQSIRANEKLDLILRGGLPVTLTDEQVEILAAKISSGIEVPAGATPEDIANAVRAKFTAVPLEGQSQPVTIVLK